MAAHDDIFPVVVIGGGLAGLSAAATLADRGIPPLILEANTDWAGGRLAGGDPDTFEHEDQQWSFPSEHGVHALWGNYDNMRAILDRFIEIELRPSPGEDWIDRIGTNTWKAEAGSAIRRTWLPAPFHYIQLLLRPAFWRSISPIDLFAAPGVMVSILLTIAIDPISEGIAWDGLMLKEYFRGWSRNLRQTFMGLARSLLAAPEDKITLTGFIAAMRFYTMLRRDSWHPSYLAGNPDTELIKPLMERIESDEGMVMMGVRAKTLMREGDHWKIQVEDARRGSRSLLAKQVIIATDAPAAKAILTDSPDTQAIADTLNFPAGLPNAAVRLWFNIAPKTYSSGGMFTGEAFADNFFWLHLIHKEFSRWAQIGGGAIEVHLYTSEKELGKVDQVLMAQVAVDVYRAFPELRGHFVHGVVRRNEATQTQFRVPDGDSLHVKTGWEGILACGDWIGYPSPTMWMERCVITGIAAANHILEANGQVPVEIIPARKPELLVRIMFRGLGILRWVIRPITGLMRSLRKRKKEKHSR